MVIIPVVPTDGTGVTGGIDDQVVDREARVVEGRGVDLPDVAIGRADREARSRVSSQSRLQPTIDQFGPHDPFPLARIIHERYGGAADGSCHHPSDDRMRIHE